MKWRHRWSNLKNNRLARGRVKELFSSYWDEALAAVAAVIFAVIIYDIILTVK